MKELKTQKTNKQWLKRIYIYMYMSFTVKGLMVVSKPWRNNNTGQKNEVFQTADLVTFTEEILHEKVPFLFSVKPLFSSLCNSMLPLLS